jgi:Putative bacterial sensory transduction regulator
MKKIAVVSMVVLAGFVWAQSNGSRQATVYDTVTSSDVSAIITRTGGAPKIGKTDDGDPRIRFDSNGVEITVDFYGCDKAGICKSLNIWAGWETDEPFDLEDINTWNYETRYGKAFSDDDAVYLDLDLDLAGGVTNEKIKAFMDLYLGQVEEFADEFQLQ